MKDTKFYPLLTLSVVFLIISFVMLCILGYNFYNQDEPRKPVAKTKPIAITQQPDPVADKTRDSLQQVYNVAVTNLKTDSAIDSALKTTDTAGSAVTDNKMTDLYKLRGEITSLLKENSSSADLELAKYKIRELQVKVDDLKNRNVDIENENRRLRALLEQLSRNNIAAANRDTRSAEEYVPRAVTESNTNAIFTASELRLAAADESDTEVNAAEATEKFVGSVVVRNTLVQGSSEVMLVLIQPDGKVLRNAWESGSFDADGGKKIYSRKIKFDYSKGEAHRLNFTVPLDSCQKGTYTLQVYSKGKVIGRVVRTVS